MHTAFREPLEKWAWKGLYNEVKEIRFPMRVSTDRIRGNALKKHLKWIIPLAAVLILAAVFFVYVGIFYPADEEGKAALESNDSVTVSMTDYGWFFDGPGEEDALIFYPGAKVEASAYAPLLRRLAEEGMDVCLVEMPFRLAFFGMNKADDVMKTADYAHWYIGGHSLGGAMAAEYAAAHREELTGVVLCAAYPTKKLDDSLLMMSIYGSRDGVLNREKVEEGKAFAPSETCEYVIQGGNHAQFGSYGAQKGDGEALISAEEFREAVVEFVIRNKR